MDIGYTIEIQGVDEVRRQAKLLANYDAIANDELTFAMNQSVMTLVGAIKPLTPIYRGALRQSIDSEVKRQGVGDIIGRVGSTLKSEEYPTVMEFGRAPGTMPPSDALERWGHLKLGIDGLGFVLARSIAARGIKGKHFMKRGLESSRKKIAGFFDQAKQRIVDRLVVK